MPSPKRRWERRSQGAARRARINTDVVGPSITPDTTLQQAFERLFQRVEELPKVEAVEAMLIRRALQLCEYNVVNAAAALGLSRATFYRRIERLGGKTALLEELG